MLGLPFEVHSPGGILPTATKHGPFDAQDVSCFCYPQEWQERAFLRCCQATIHSWEVHVPGQVRYGADQGYATFEQSISKQLNLLKPDICHQSPTSETRWAVSGKKGLLSHGTSPAKGFPGAFDIFSVPGSGDLLYVPGTFS